MKEFSNFPDMIKDNLKNNIIQIIEIYELIKQANSNDSIEYKNSFKELEKNILLFKNVTAKAENILQSGDVDELKKFYHGEYFQKYQKVMQLVNLLSEQI